MTKFIDNYFGEYGIRARLFPALICILPFILLKHSILDHYYKVSFNQVIYGDISIGLILIYLMIQINRFLSKSLFENKDNFPTDKILLPSNKGLSNETRNKITEKIYTDFNLHLPTQKDEDSNIDDTKKKIREIVKLIIGKAGNGELILQHNIEYGFIRNFMGGSVISLIFSIINIYLFVFISHNTILFVVSIILSLIYLIPIIFSKKILKQYGEAYTDILFREYLQSK